MHNIISEAKHFTSTVVTGSADGLLHFTINAYDNFGELLPGKGFMIADNVHIFNFVKRNLYCGIEAKINICISNISDFKNTCYLELSLDYWLNFQIDFDFAVKYFH